MGIRKLILEDGTVFIGKSFGAKREVSGEIIFHTAMTGYQEIITDPAYYKQILLFTYPLIGNYGINRDDFEGVSPLINGLIVKELTKEPSNFRSDESLENYLLTHDIPGISNIDTRKLMRHIQKHGTMRGYLTMKDESPQKLVQILRKQREEKDLVKQIATDKPYVIPGRGRRIVVVDLGMKHGILRSLTNRKAHITVVPYDFSAKEILRLRPEGILLTSGPGDPHTLTETIYMTKDLLGKVPIFAIGMGLQVLALASGATLNIRSVPHSGTYPVKDLLTKKTFMTNQNHRYDIEESSLKGTLLNVTHRNLHDKSIEGLVDEKHETFGVQFYPEHNPGPEDASYLFDQFFFRLTKGAKIYG